MTNGMDWMEPPPEPRRRWRQRSDNEKARLVVGVMAGWFVVSAGVLFATLNPIGAATLLLLAVATLVARGRIR
jgi:hypothetical protein